MDVLHQNDYEQLTRGATVLAKNAWGVSVMQLHDGQYAKLFRPASLFSSSRVRPYAVRFQRASYELARRGIPTVAVSAVYHVKHLGQHLVLYHPIDGIELRDALADTAKCSELLPASARFIARLHHKGVYFRSLHFGNVLVDDAGKMGLIDIAATRFKSAPLGSVMRLRNFQRVHSYPQDRDDLQDFGPADYVEQYRSAAEQLGDGRIAKRLAPALIQLLSAG